MFCLFSAGRAQAVILLSSALAAVGLAGPSARTRATAGVAQEPERRLTDWPGVENNPRFSPDGQWLAFEAVVDGDSAIYLMRLNDGTTRRLTDGRAADGRPAWSPDGRTIAFQSNRGGPTGIWSVPVDGGDPVAVFVSAGRTAMAPDFARDGRLVATVVEPDATRNYGHVTPWVMDADGRRARSVTRGGDEWWARWGPDGRLYAYTGAVDDLLAIDVATGSTRILSQGVHIGWRPAPSPNGRDLAFVAPPGWSLWIRSVVDPPALRRLSRHGREDFPDFSPDGRSLAYSSDRSRGEIVSLDLRTRERRALAFGTAPGPLERDGSFAYLAETGDPYRPMYFRGATGRSTALPAAMDGVDAVAVANASRLVAVSGSGSGPHRDRRTQLVAPDGSSRDLPAAVGAHALAWCDATGVLLFSATDPNGLVQVHRLDVATGESTQLTSTPSSKLVIACARDERVVTARLTAGRAGLVLIERAAGGPWSERTVAEASEAALSPDGSQLAFVQRSGGRVDLFLRRADGGTIRLTDDDRVESSPQWSLDGARLVFATRRGGRDLWLLPVPGRDAR